VECVMKNLNNNKLLRIILVISFFMPHAIFSMTVEDALNKAITDSSRDDDGSDHRSTCESIQNEISNLSRSKYQIENLEALYKKYYDEHILSTMYQSFQDYKKSPNTDISQIIEQVGKSHQLIKKRNELGISRTPYEILQVFDEACPDQKVATREVDTDIDIYPKRLKKCLKKHNELQTRIDASKKLMETISAQIKAIEQTKDFKDIEKMINIAYRISSIPCGKSGDLAIDCEKAMQVDSLPVDVNGAKLVYNSGVILAELQGQQSITKNNKYNELISLCNDKKLRSKIAHTCSLMNSARDKVSDAYNNRPEVKKRRRDIALRKLEKKLSKDYHVVLDTDERGNAYISEKIPRKTTATMVAEAFNSSGIYALPYLWGQTRYLDIMGGLYGQFGTPFTGAVGGALPALPAF
jgi:hypothetical protein